MLYYLLLNCLIEKYNTYIKLYEQLNSTEEIYETTTKNMGTDIMLHPYIYIYIYIYIFLIPNNARQGVDKHVMTELTESVEIKTYIAYRDYHFCSEVKL